MQGTIHNDFKITLTEACKKILLSQVMRWSLIQHTLCCTLSYGDKIVLSPPGELLQVARKQSAEHQIKKTSSRRDLATPTKQVGAIVVERERLLVPPQVVHRKRSVQRRTPGDFTGSAEKLNKAMVIEEERLDQRMKDFERQRAQHLRDIEMQQTQLAVELASLGTKQKSLQQQDDDMRASRATLMKREEDLSRRMSEFMAKQSQVERDHAARATSLDILEKELDSKSKRMDSYLSKLVKKHEDSILEFDNYQEEFLNKVNLHQKQLELELETMKRQREMDKLKLKDLEFCQNTLLAKEPGIEESMQFRTLLIEKETKISEQMTQIEQLERIINQMQQSTHTQTIIPTCVLACGKKRRRFLP